MKEPVDHRAVLRLPREHYNSRWMGTRALVILVVLFQAASAASQSKDTVASPIPSSPNTADTLTPDQRALVEKLANLQRNLGKKMNSAAVELTLKELERVRGDDRTLVHYGLYATGLSNKTIYTLFQIQLNGSLLKNLEGVTLNAEGRAICAGSPDTCSGDGPNDPIDLIVYAGKSEPKRFALISEDGGHLKGFVAVVPFPNYATDKGCRVESIIGTANGELTFIQGTGFEPNSEVIVDGQSYDEKHHDVAKTTADGFYFAAVMPCWGRNPAQLAST